MVFRLKPLFSSFPTQSASLWGGKKQLPAPFVQLADWIKLLERLARSSASVESWTELRVRSQLKGAGRRGEVMPASCCFSSVSRPVLHSPAASAFLKQLRRRAHQKLFMRLTLQAELRVACGTLHQSWTDRSLLPFDYLIYSAFPKFPQELTSLSEWLILWHISWIKVGLQLTGYQTSYMVPTKLSP